MTVAFGRVSIRRSLPWLRGAGMDPRAGGDDPVPSRVPTARGFVDSFPRIASRTARRRSGRRPGRAYWAWGARTTLYVRPPLPRRCGARRCRARAGHHDVEGDAVVDPGLVVGHGRDDVGVDLRDPRDPVRAGHVPYPAQRLGTVLVERRGLQLGGERVQQVGPGVEGGLQLADALRTLVHIQLVGRPGRRTRPGCPGRYAVSLVGFLFGSRNRHRPVLGPDRLGPRPGGPPGRTRPRRSQPGSRRSDVTPDGRLLDCQRVCSRVARLAGPVPMEQYGQQQAGSVRAVPRPPRRRNACASAQNNSPATAGVPKKTASPAPMLASAVPAVSTR